MLRNSKNMIQADTSLILIHASISQNEKGLFEKKVSEAKSFDDLNRTAFFTATTNGDLTTVILLLNKYPELLQARDKYDTALLHAASYGQLAVVQ